MDGFVPQSWLIIRRNSEYTGDESRNPPASISWLADKRILSSSFQIGTSLCHACTMAISVSRLRPFIELWNLERKSVDMRSGMLCHAFRDLDPICQIHGMR